MNPLQASPFIATPWTVDGASPPVGGPITGTLTLNNSTPQWGLGEGGVGPVTPTAIEGIDIDAFYYDNSTQKHQLHLRLVGGVKIPSLASDNMIAVTVVGSPINPIYMGWDGTKYLSSFDATFDAFFTVDDAVLSWSIEAAVPFYTGSMTVGFDGSNYGFSDGAVFGAKGSMSPVDLNGANISAIQSPGSPQVSMIMVGFVNIPTIGTGHVWIELDSELPAWLDSQAPQYVGLGNGPTGDYLVAQNGNTIGVKFYGAI